MDKTKIYDPLEVNLEEIRKDSHAGVFVNSQSKYNTYAGECAEHLKVFWNGELWVIDNPKEGELKDTPIYIIEKMLVNQVTQGNLSDIKVFQRNKIESAVSGGFDWYLTLEGNTYWKEKTWLKEGKKDSEGKLYYELSWEFIEEMAKRMANNKGEKYPLYNWKLSMGEDGIEGLKQAINRHHIEVMKGNYQDGDEPLGHILAYACNSMMLWEQLKNKYVKI